MSLAYSLRVGGGVWRRGGSGRGSHLGQSVFNAPACIARTCTPSLGGLPIGGTHEFREVDFAIRCDLFDESMRNHGIRQQGPSPAHIAFSKALVDAFVPQWPELLGSDGGVWDLRKEFDFEEFTLTLARMADKACGRDGMQLGFIRMLSREMQWQFWDLLVRCAELGTFPDVWATVTAVLIPKKSGSSIRIDD